MIHTFSYLTVFQDSGLGGKRILEQDERRQASGAHEVRWYTAKMAAAELAVARGLTALVGRRRGSRSLGADEGEQQQKEEEVK